MKKCFKDWSMPKTWTTDIQKFYQLENFLATNFNPFRPVEFSMKLHTVKPVLSGHLKTDKTKVLKTKDSLMKVKSIAECSLKQ